MSTTDDIVTTAKALFNMGHHAAARELLAHTGEFTAKTTITHTVVIDDDDDDDIEDPDEDEDECVPEGDIAARSLDAQLAYVAAYAEASDGAPRRNALEAQAFLAEAASKRPQRSHAPTPRTIDPRPLDAGGEFTITPTGFQKRTGR